MSSNSPLRVLVVGSQGQVGQALVKQIPADALAAGLDRQGLDLSDVDRLADSLHTAIETHRPTVLINAAAYTAVDRAETEQTLAYDVNALAPGIMATVAAACQIPMVHYSTDYVFDGLKNEPYVESDATHPTSVYGRSKLAGEKAVRAANGAHLIFRTSWVFGAHGQNFLKTMLQLAQTRDTLNVVNDQVGTPTAAHWIAQATLASLNTLSNRPVDDPRWGLYHLTAHGATSWHGYAHYLIEKARSMGWPISVSAEGIQGISTANYPTAAPRPMNSRLSTQKLVQTFALEPRDWQTDVDRVLLGMRPNP